MLQVNSQKLITFIKLILLSILLYYLIFISKAFDFKILYNFFNASGAVFFIYIFFLLGILQVITTLRQNLLINIYSDKLTFFQSLKIVIIGLFYNNFIPSAYGGDAVRVFLINKKTNIGIATTAFLLILDRGLAFLGILVMAGISFIILDIKYGITGLININSIIWFIAIPVIAAVIIIFKIHRILEIIPDKFQIKHKLLNFINGISGLRNHKKILFLSFATSFIGSWILFAAIASIGAYLYGIKVFFPYLITGPVIALLGIIPLTPGNVGVMEALGELVLNKCGVPGGATVYIVWRFVYTLLSILGGLFSVSRQK